jgi:hypothetical protein
MQIRICTWILAAAVLQLVHVWPRAGQARVAKQTVGRATLPWQYEAWEAM